MIYNYTEKSPFLL